MTLLVLSETGVYYGTLLTVNGNVANHYEILQSLYLMQTDMLIDLILEREEHDLVPK